MPCECNCGQDECLPARQFNREVEIHTARAGAVAEWRELREAGADPVLQKYYRDFPVALAGLLKVQFGGDR